MNKNEETSIVETSKSNINEEVIQPIVFYGDTYNTNPGLNQLFVLPYKNFKKSNIFPYGQCQVNNLLMSKHFIIMNVSDAIISKIAQVVERYFTIEPYMYNVYKFAESGKIHDTLEATLLELQRTCFTGTPSTETCHVISQGLFSASVLIINNFIQDFCANYVFAVGDYMYHHNPLYKVIYELCYDEKLTEEDIKNPPVDRANQYNLCTSVIREMFENDLDDLNLAIKKVVAGAYGIWFA